MKYEDIEDAYFFVSMAPQFTNSAIIDRDEGIIYYTSEDVESDELPEDIEESKKYIEIPHQTDLDLGRQLVDDFTSENCPEYQDRIEEIFFSQGAYSRYKSLLSDLGLLDKWYEYENTKTKAALLEWCKTNNIEITG